MIPQQKWERLFRIDWESMNPTNKRSGYPKVDLAVPNGGTGTEWEIYTDGSRDPGKNLAGAGIAVYVNGREIWTQSFGLGDRSVFQAELYGIRKAAQWMLTGRNRNLIMGDEVNIYTDNQAALKAIKSHWLKSF